jgi:DNA modification methylase
MPITQKYDAFGITKNNYNNNINKLLNRVYCSDALSFLQDMQDNCVDLVITSPPY